MSTTDHVPEHQNQEDQFSGLHNLLLGNAAFGRLRGALNGTLSGFVDDCLEAGSPTATLRAWDQQVGDLRVMLNLLAKLRRDGWMLAEMELKRALIDRKYVLPGETIPVEQTIAYTVFMIDPEIILALHQFFQDWWTFLPEESERGISPPTFWKSYADEAFCNERYGPVLWPLFREIYWNNVYNPTNLPQYLPHHADPGRIFGRVMTLFGARVADLDTRRVGKRTMEFSPWGFPRERFGTTYAKLAGNSRRFSNMSCLYGKAVEQSKLLGAFSREDQRRVASWQFHLPAAMIGDERVYAICLRPEAERAQWYKKRPQFTSRGVAHGYCAVLVPFDHVDRVFAGENPDRLRLFQNSKIFDSSFVR